MRRGIGLVVVLVAAAIVGTANPSGAAVTCAESHTGETLVGPVTVPAGAMCVLFGSRVEGSVSVGAGGMVRLRDGSTVTGNIVTNGGGIQVHASSVGGNVQAQAPVGIQPFHPFVLCESTFDGTVTVRSAPGSALHDTVRIGDTGFSDCDGGNRIRGSLTVSSNTVIDTDVNSPDELVIQNNVIGGSITCLGNTPAPTVTGNTVTGAKVGQCSAP